MCAEPKRLGIGAEDLPAVPPAGEQPREEVHRDVEAVSLLAAMLAVAAERVQVARHLRVGRRAHLGVV